jgi:outer membrane protein assembly factor BamD
MNNLVKTSLLIAMSAILFQGCAAPKLTGTPEELYQEGEQSFKKGYYADAIAQWKKVKESYQSPELTSKAELSLADAYFTNKDFIEAAAAYEDFRKLHPNHDQAGFALYRQAMSYYSQITGTDTDQTPVKNAVITFESYVKLYPAGQYVAEVTEKIRDCRDKQLQYEIYVGRFYLKQEKLTAAIARFEGALKTFGDLPRCDEALYYLGRAYKDAEQLPKARATFERLLKEFPASQYAPDASTAIRKL